MGKKYIKGKYIKTIEWGPILKLPRFDSDNWTDKIQKPDIFFNVGAGQPRGMRDGPKEAWAFCKKWPKVKIIGFEPSQPRYNSLKHKKYPGKLEPFGLSNKGGKLKFYNSQSNTMLSSTDPGKNVRSRIVVEVCRLDKYCADNNISFDNGFVWADIEGDEIKMLEGAGDLLKDGKFNGFLLEVSRIIRNDRPNYKDVINYLDKYNFKPKYAFNSLNKNSSITDVIFLKE